MHASRNGRSFLVAEKLVGTESDQAGDQTYVLAHLRHAVLPEASDVVVLNQEEIEAEITTRATVISDSATQLETAGEELAKYREELSKLFGTQRSDIEGRRCNRCACCYFRTTQSISPNRD